MASQQREYDYKKEEYVYLLPNKGKTGKQINEKPLKTMKTQVKNRSKA